MPLAASVRRAAFMTSIAAAAMAASGSAAAHETPCEPCAPLAPVAGPVPSDEEEKKEDGEAWAPPVVAPGPDLTTSGYVGVGILATGLGAMVVGTTMFASVGRRVSPRQVASGARPRARLESFR